MPVVHLVRFPLQVSCERMVSKCRVGQPVLCKFFIKNISEEVHSVYVSMGYEVGKDERSDFL